MSKNNSEDDSRKTWRRRVLGSFVLGLILFSSWAILHFSDDSHAPELSPRETASVQDSIESLPLEPRRFTRPVPEAIEIAEDTGAKDLLESKGREGVISMGPLQGLSGVVLSPKGEAIALAGVSLFLVENREAIATTRSFQDGKFFLSTRDLPNCSAVLTAHADGFHPFSKGMDIFPGVDERNLVLRLGEGCDLAGRVTLDGEPCAALISLDSAYGVSGLHGASKELFLKDGKIVTKHGTAVAGQDGRFRVRGLSPGESRLDLRLVDWQRHFVPGGIIQQVQVPNEDCSINLHYVQHRVEVQSEGKLVESADLTVRHLTTGSHQGSKGQMEVGLLPGEDYVATATAEGYTPQALEFQASETSGANRIVVVMKPAPQRNLVVNWLGAENFDVRAIEVELDVIGGDRAGKGLPPQELNALRSARLGDLRLAEGDPSWCYRWNGLPYPPGRYKLKIKVRRAPGQFETPMVLPAETTVEIPELGEVACSLPCTAGSSLRFTTHAPMGAGPWGNWELRRPDGKGIARGFVDLSKGAHPQAQPIDTILASGDYVLRIETEGREIKTYNIQIPAGVIHDFEIDLDCPPKPQDMGPWFREHKLAGVLYLRDGTGSAMITTLFF